jgi:hypothetical protein
MAAKHRDLRFDSLRGLMLVCMMVNHLPSALRILTDQSLGLFSAAEGFVFLSGLLAGWVYTRRLRAEGPVELRRSCQRRAATIYSWQLGAFMGSLALVQLTSGIFGFCSYTSPKLFYTHPLLAALLGSAMLHQPGLLDFLPMYCAFVLALPFVLRVLEAGGRVPLLAASFALWLAVQFAPPFDGTVLYPIHIGTFNLFAWQFLFFAGVAIGHARVADATPQVRFNPVLAAAALAVAVLGWGVHHLQWRPIWSDAMFGTMVNKPALGALRLADFAAVAYLIAVLGGRFPRVLSWRPLAFLGRHSLPVVGFQTLLIMILLEFPSLFATALGDWATTAAAIAILFAIAAAHEAWGQLGTRPILQQVGAGQPLSLSLGSANDIRAT